MKVEPVPSLDVADGILNSGDQAARLQVRKGFAPGIDVARSIRHATQAILTNLKALEEYEISPKLRDGFVRGGPKYFDSMRSLKEPGRVYRILMSYLST